ncbi:hypothetical protein CNR22_13550 [Sphingobacteriaceae bacterium]|nr:hypothetical protein CNR22_13550 [Sphingobacteriaceae bacterium]
MSGLYIPSTPVFEKLQQLAQGFWLDLDSEDKPALLIKLEASVTDSIISGCPLELVLRNPNVTPRSCTLYIYDRSDEPLFVNAEKLSEEDQIHKGFDFFAIKLLQSSEIIIALYNELAHPIFRTEAKLDIERAEFDKWVFNIYNNPEYKNYDLRTTELPYLPEDSKIGFSIKISNTDHSAQEKPTTIHLPFDQPFNKEDFFFGQAFNQQDFQGDGKHGYYQEFSVTAILNRVMTDGIDFFVSPKNIDGTEFCDYIIIDNNRTLLIESKYVQSLKPTKRHAAITKAILQLNNTEKEIITDAYKLEDPKLVSALNNVEYVLKICLLSSKTVLTPENSKTIITQHQKSELPIFIPVSTFSQIAAAMALIDKDRVAKNLLNSLANIYHDFMESSDEIRYVNLFKIKGYSLEQLNAFGQKHV